MYIVQLCTSFLVGPFVRFDQVSQSYVSVFTAKPVPQGMTVIATPLRIGNNQTPNNSSSMSKSRSQFNPNAAPFVPSKALQSVTDVKDDTSEDPNQQGKRGPCFMYWSSEYPEGKLLPFRQPQPPVYFQVSPNS